MVKSNVYVYSHIGNSRKMQEDNFFVSPTHFLSEKNRNGMSCTKTLFSDFFSVDDDYLVAVMDGLGGCEYGEYASMYVAQYFCQHQNELLKSRTDSRETLVNFISQMNHDLSKTVSDGGRRIDTGTTLCGILFSSNRLLCFNVGDSRAYRFCENELQQISVDNTESRRLFEMGLLKKNDMDSFQHKGAIYKYVGMKCELIPDVYEINIQGNSGLFILCSDGVSDVLNEADIVDIISMKSISVEDKGYLLMDMAYKQNQCLGDNLTLIIVDHGVNK